MSFTGFRSQGSHKDPWEFRGLSGQSKEGGCELNCRGSWPTSEPTRKAQSSQSQEQPTRRGWAQEEGEGRGVLHEPTANLR